MGAVSPATLGRPYSRLQGEEARECLFRAGLAELQDKPLAELSGGQRQRVFLDRALIKKFHLLLLDEPDAGLDIPSQGCFYGLLQELQCKGGIFAAALALLIGYISQRSSMRDDAVTGILFVSGMAIN